MFANTYVGNQDDSKAAAAAASIACSTHHEYDIIFPRKHLVGMLTTDTNPHNSSCSTDTNPHNSSCSTDTNPHNSYESRSSRIKNIDHGKFSPLFFNPQPKIERKFLEVVCLGGNVGRLRLILKFCLLS